MAKVVPDTQFQILLCSMGLLDHIGNFRDCREKLWEFHLSLSFSQIVDLQGELILERRAASPDNYLELKR